MTRKRVLSLLASFVVVAVFAVFMYRHLRAQASDRIKGQILAVADDMTLTPEDRIETKRLIAAAHEQAFDDALHLTAKQGEKFDAKGYITGLFDRVVAAARAEGRTDLADTIAGERANFSFTITER